VSRAGTHDACAAGGNAHRDEAPQSHRTDQGADVDASTLLGIEKVSRAVVYLLYFFVLLALVILTLGFFLLVLGANPDAAFAEWTYRSLDKVMAPFRGLFEPVDLSGRSVLDPSIIFAMVVYAILGMALRALIDWLTYRMRLTESRRAALTAAPPWGPGTAPAGTAPTATVPAATDPRPYPTGTPARTGTPPPAAP
jgi:hypothetical protein